MSTPENADFSLDNEFVGAILRGGEAAFRKAMEKGIDPDVHLYGEGRATWNYLIEHKKEYGLLPTSEFINAKMGLSIPTRLADPAEVFIDEILKRRVHRVIIEGSDEVKKRLDARDPIGGAERISEIHRQLRTEKLTTARIENLFGYATEVWQDYLDAKAGKRGISTPWPTMTEQTMGWQKEDLILFVGRLGVGKTWVALLAAHVAWKDKKKVLFVSTEMSKAKLARRLFAMHLQLPFGALTSGKLGEFLEEDAQTRILGLLNETGIDVVGGGFDFSIDNIEAAIDEAEPDLMCVDGAYLIKNSGKDRHERVSNTFDDLKRFGKTKKISVLANSQFNRSAKNGNDKTMVAENVGMTDVAGFNSDLMYAIGQDDEQRRDKKITIKSMKVREGEPKSFTSNWDFERMDFSEIRDPDAEPVDDGSSTTTAVEDLGELPF